MAFYRCVKGMPFFHSVFRAIFRGNWRRGCIAKAVVSLNNFMFVYEGDQGNTRTGRNR